MIEENREQGAPGEQQFADVAGENPAETTTAETEERTDGSVTDEATVEALQERYDALYDQLMRVVAEFDNYKKRMERERAKQLKYAEENILRDLLGTVDNLDRAIEQGQGGEEEENPHLQSMLEGVELTRKGLMATLERFGVEAIESVGESFNPDEHDAMLMEASEETPANHVLREFAKGYRFKDRILRHARVVVSSGPAQAA
ncbi:MAG: nucleotide exchange factor GrpE [Desulfobulbus sp.]